MKYNKVIIGGHPSLIGEPQQDINPISYFGLNVGDKIKQIGRLTKSEKQSSSSRLIKINPYMTYVGLFYNNDVKFMAFKIPEHGVTGWNLFNHYKNVYPLFIPLDIPGQEKELILQNYDTQNITIMKAVFEFVT